MTDNEAITEFRTRLLAGHYGDRAFMPPEEETYSGMWSALCTKLVEWEDRFGWSNPVVHEIRTAMNALADVRPNAVAVFALNTARYGEEHDLH